LVGPSVISTKRPDALLTVPVSIGRLDVVVSELWSMVADAVTLAPRSALLTFCWIDGLAPNDWSRLMIADTCDSVMYGVCDAGAEIVPPISAVWTLATTACGAPNELRRETMAEICAEVRPMLGGALGVAVTVTEAEQVTVPPEPLKVPV
jgi:hypothetical protein